MSKRSFYVRESELDDFQRQVLNKKVDKSFIVKGCAGSGKSILALWKAHDIASNNRGSLQIVVFSKALKSYMEEALRTIGVSPSLVDYWHHWKNNPRRSDYIIVDEVQDFGQDAINAFMNHARIAIFYGDSAQQLSRSVFAPKGTTLKIVAETKDLKSLTFSNSIHMKRK